MIGIGAAAALGLGLLAGLAGPRAGSSAVDARAALAPLQATVVGVTPPSAVVRAPAPAVAHRDRAAPAAASAAPIAALRARLEASSLRDTERDGRVTLDARGAARADAELRRLFDHYLTLIGELDPAAIRALLADDLRSGFDAAVAAGVLELFDRYVGYQRALAALAPGSIDDLDRRAARVRALRREWLGAAADGLFADEEAELAAALDRLALARDPTLDADQREARLAGLEATLPPEQRDARRLATAAALAEEQTRQLDALGAPTAMRHAERAALWGAPAADRLAQLDRERLAWAQRVAAYRTARDAIVAAHGHDAQRSAAALQALRAGSFDAIEQRRIAALEAAGLLPPADP